MKLPEEAVCVITGAGSGLGRELAVLLAHSRKARLWLADIDLASAEKAAAEAREQGAREAHAVACDVRDAAAFESLARRVAEASGAPDLLVNNAGVAAVGLFEEVSLDDWRWCVDTNLWGVVHGCRAFLPELKSRGRGHILNVASAAGLLSPPKLGPYNVAKAAAIAASETLRAECAGTGVGVTVACPTFFPTGIFAAARTTAPHLPKLAGELTKWTGLSAEDVARACLRAVERNELYVLPSFDARMMWRLKRSVPSSFARLASAVISHLEKKYA